MCIHSCLCPDQCLYHLPLYSCSLLEVQCWVGFSLSQCIRHQCGKDALHSHAHQSHAPVYGWWLGCLLMVETGAQNVPNCLKANPHNPNSAWASRMMCQTCPGPMEALVGSSAFRQALSNETPCMYVLDRWLVVQRRARPKTLRVLETPFTILCQLHSFDGKMVDMEAVFSSITKNGPWGQVAHPAQPHVVSAMAKVHWHSTMPEVPPNWKSSQ